MSNQLRNSSSNMSGVLVLAALGFRGHAKTVFARSPKLVAHCPSSRITQLSNSYWQAESRYTYVSLGVRVRLRMEVPWVRQTGNKLMQLILWL